MSNHMLTLAEQETLGWAIKATGRTAHDIDEHGAWFKGESDPIVGAWSKFNPFASDADAFRLAVQLRMRVEYCEASVLSHRFPAMRASLAPAWHCALIDGTRDACTAARLAIVECAATIYRHSLKDTTP